MTDDRKESETILGNRVPCRHCGAYRWVYLDDDDNGDWVEASYKCAGCRRIEYVELPD